MKYEDFERIVIRLKELNEEGDQYIGEVPSDLQSMLYDNGYANAQGMMVDTLMQATFGKVLAEEVYYFLYELPTLGGNALIEVPTEAGGTITWHIRNDEDFLFYVKSNYTWDK